MAGHSGIVVCVFSTTGGAATAVARVVAALSGTTAFVCNFLLGGSVGDVDVAIAANPFCAIGKPAWLEFLRGERLSSAIYVACACFPTCTRLLCRILCRRTVTSAPLA